MWTHWPGPNWNARQVMVSHVTVTWTRQTSFFLPCPSLDTTQVSHLLEMSGLHLPIIGKALPCPRKENCKRTKGRRNGRVCLIHFSVLPKGKGEREGINKRKMNGLQLCMPLHIVPLEVFARSTLSSTSLFPCSNFLFLLCLFPSSAKQEKVLCLMAFHPHFNSSPWPVWKNFI